jgi:methylphosphotriester-DNA--protein-cysteine methyltransferase
MYYSVLQQTGIHCQNQGEWGFYPPEPSSPQPPSPRTGEGGVTQSGSPLPRGEGLGVRVFGQSNLGPIWAAMAEFCLSTTDTPRSISELYQTLNAPPYGMKSGTIPVLLAAVLLHYSDEVSVYKEGTFIPVLGPEHFEILVKDPARFAVKHIEVTGVRSQVFRELEAILRGGATQPRHAGGARNVTVLSVVKPLIQFVRKLPNFTLKTRRLSESSRAVLQTLRSTQDPDDLLFNALPQACGLAPIVVSEADDGTTARIYRERLVDALREINGAYDALLSEGQALLYSAFGVHHDRTQLRQDLQFRASRVLGNCVEASLNRFARAAADDAVGDRQWLEAVLMVIADKPAESWLDEDVTRFELNLSHLSRRFKNLEALQALVKATSASGFEARRLTVTRPDGSEINKLVWASDEHQAKVDPTIDEILQQFPDPQLQEVLLTRLTERMFDGPELEQDNPSEKITDLKGRRVRPRRARG